MLNIRHLTVVALFAALLGVHAVAEEGMWTFDHPPTAAIQQKYGFAVTPMTAGLDRSSRPMAWC